MPTAFAQRALPVTLSLLAVLALIVPMRWQRWAGAIGDQVVFVTGPISGPINRLAGWLHGTRRPQDDEGIRVLELELERQKQLRLQSAQEIQRLQQIIRDLGVARAFNPDLRLRLEPVGVIAGGSDPASGILVVRAGLREGVSGNAVAVAPGWQLLGRVVKVAERTSSVQLITAKNAPPFTARIMLDEERNTGLTCTLSPRADGTLAGPVEDRREDGAASPIEPAVGQTVRLDDPTWPAISRMLLVGRIERVEPNPQQPLRKLITVRPVVDHLHRVSEGFLLIPDDGTETPP